MADRKKQDGPKPLPALIEVEQSLLGALMINDQNIHAVSPILEPHHFFEPVHADIYRAIQDLAIQGKHTNPVMVKNQMEGSTRQIGQLTMSQYLARLTSETVGSFAIVDQAKAIKEVHGRRHLISIATNLIETAYDVGDAVILSEECGLAQSAIGGVVAQIEDREAFHGGSLLEGYLSMIGKGEDRSGSIGVPMPFKELQTILSESKFEAKNLYGMLSSSGEGKSSATMQIIYHAAMLGHPVCFFSYDQTGPQCVGQMVAQHEAIELRRQKSGDLTDKDMDRAVSFATELSLMPFEVIECSSAKDTPSKLASRAKAFLKRNMNGQTPLFVYDHMSAIPVEYEDRSADEGSKALRKGQALKEIAKSTNGVSLVLQQRSGTGLTRFNPRPIPSDLYGGEGARQPFDAIFYLFRAEEHMRRQVDTAKDAKQIEEITNRFTRMFPANVGLENMAEIGTLKTRFGRVGQKRYLRFVGEYTRYESIYNPVEEDQGGFF